MECQCNRQHTQSRHSCEESMQLMIRLLQQQQGTTGSSACCLVLNVVYPSKVLGLVPVLPDPKIVFLASNSKKFGRFWKTFRYFVKIEVRLNLHAGFIKQEECPRAHIDNRLNMETLSSLFLLHLLYLLPPGVFPVQKFTLGSHYIPCHAITLNIKSLRDSVQCFDINIYQQW